MENFIEHFLSPDEEQELLNLLESETFTREGNRGVLQFGEYYKYMGSKTRPKSYPESIVRIMEKLNKDFGTKHRDSRYHYQVNSCLVNKYEGVHLTYLNTLTMKEIYAPGPQYSLSPLDQPEQ